MTLTEHTTEALVAELRRRQRHFNVDPADLSLIVGDLEVDPVGCVATWRGQAIRLSAGRCQLLYKLALARWQGVKWVRCDRLAVSIYRSAGESEISCIRQQVYYLRRDLPGLILTRQSRTPGRYGAYGLAVDAQEAAA